MDKIKEFLNTKNGRITVGVVGGIVLLLLILGVSTPKAVNIYNFNGNDSVNSTKSAKKIVKDKTKKEKKS